MTVSAPAKFFVNWKVEIICPLAKGDKDVTENTGSSDKFDRFAAEKTFA